MFYKKVIAKCFMTKTVNFMLMWKVRIIKVIMPDSFILRTGFEE